MTSDLPDTPVTWHYLPVTHYICREGRHYLTLTDHDGADVRMTVVCPEAADLLEPYLHLHNLEQQDPWTHSPAYIPVEQTEGQWQFSTAGALYDREVVTDSGTAEAGEMKPYRRPTFQ